MAEDRPRTLLAAIGTLQGLLPVSYQLLGPDPEPAPRIVVAESLHHRTKGYYCLPFYKHISRTFTMD